MTKKKKDFFESVLSDVRPLNKKKHIVFKHDESTNKPKIKHKKVEFIKKTIAVEEKRPTNQNQLSYVINDKSNLICHTHSLLIKSIITIYTLLKLTR